MACVAVGCKSRMGGWTDDNKKKLSFHRFPKEASLRERWIQNINRIGWTPSPYSRVCSLHFEDSCYREDYLNTTLHSDAVPTKFNNSQIHFFMVKKEDQSRWHNPPVPEFILPSTFNNDYQDKISELEDIISEQNKTIKKLKYIADHYKTIAEERELDLKKMKQRYIRQTKRIEYSDTIISELENKLRMDAAKIETLCVMIGKDN